MTTIMRQRVLRTTYVGLLALLTYRWYGVWVAVLFGLWWVGARRWQPVGYEPGERVI